MDTPANRNGADATRAPSLLEAAAQVFALSAALLPVTGFVVVATKLMSAPHHPVYVAGSESLPGLAVAGLFPLVVAVGPLIAVWVPQKAGDLSRSNAVLVAPDRAEEAARSRRS